MLGQWSKAALLASGLLIIFYSYGHVYQILGEVEFIGVTLRRHRHLAPLYAAIGIALAIVIVRSNPPTSLTRFLNGISLLLISFSIARIASIRSTTVP